MVKKSHSVGLAEMVRQHVRKRDRAKKLWKEAEVIFEEILPKLLRQPDKTVAGYRLKHNFSDSNTVYRAKVFSEYELEKAAS